MLSWAIAILALLVAGFAAYVRLAPSDPALWNGPVAVDGAADCTVQAGRGDARAACTLTVPPADALARLDAVAMATPRTIRLAGSPDQGRITWVTRSLLWGFPDYITAEARPDAGGSRIDLYARLRFGSEDMGVNAARLTDWLARLDR